MLCFAKRAGAGTSALATQHTTDMPSSEGQPEASALLEAVQRCLTYSSVS